MRSLFVITHIPLNAGIAGREEFSGQRTRGHNWIWSDGSGRCSAFLTIHLSNVKVTSKERLPIHTKFI